MSILRKLYQQGADGGAAVLLLIGSLSSSFAEADSTHTLNDITVQGSLVETESITRSEEMGKLEINAEEILKLPSVGEADIARSLKLIPGVSVGNENSAQLIVQGSAGTESHPSRSNSDLLSGPLFRFLFPL